MGVVIVWANLWLVGLPFLLCACVGGIFSVFLWRAAWKSGMPHRREPCATCVFEKALIKQGYCKESCAVNTIPMLPLVLFLATCTFALLFLFFPSVVFTYLLPSTSPNPTTSVPEWQQSIRTVVAAANGAAAVLLGAYFVQDTAWHRELFLRVAAAGSLAGIVIGVTAPGPVGQVALEVTPFALLAVLLSAALESRARWGRPVLGLRALGISTTPLFIVTLVGIARILSVLSAANARGI